MSNNRCFTCGQWSGSEHRCPAPQSPEEYTQQLLVQTTNGTYAADVAARTARAKEYLNSETPTTRYFHGTRTRLTIGERLVPGWLLRKTNWRPDRSRHVYITTSPTLARVYAEEAKGRGKPRIIEVIPDFDTLEPDDVSRFEGSENNEQFRTTEATVVRAVWEADTNEQRTPTVYVNPKHRPPLPDMSHLLNNP